MLAPTLKLRPVVRQTHGETPAVLTDILEDGVNLAVWQRQLPLHIAEFGALLVALNEPLAESLVVELNSEDAEPNLQDFASGCRDLEGYEGFGLIHRSPPLQADQRRLILTLDWLE